MAAVVKIYPDEHAWIDAAAGEIAREMQAAVTARGAAFVALSGGRTPVGVYQRLTLPPWRDCVPWKQVHWFWADERWVPPSHADNNFRLTWEAMLSKVPVDESKVHRIPTEGMEPQESAMIYETFLRELILPSSSGLDLAVLGMGADGHTASLFPGSPALAELEHWMAAAEAPVGTRQRITMTLPLLNASATLMFLVTGANKQKVLEAVLRDDAKASRYPAAMTKATGQTLWIVDNAAMGI